jgi:hypothetical protein
MELARHELPRNGYSKFIHPQSDLGKEIQSLHRSLQVIFCPTRKVEVKDHFDPADDFSTDRFPSTKSYPPGSSITFQLPNRIYGYFITEAHLHLTALTPPAIKTTIMLNSKLTQRSWLMVDWELWGRSASELTATKLLAVVKFVHKEWPSGHRLHRYHKTDPG